MNKTEEIAKLLDVMRTLRGENGCPWDKEQTIESLKPYIIEEAFETVEAIDELKRDDEQSVAELKKELGDLLLQVVFVSQIASEESIFEFEDVARAITSKLITRHPHVFGDEKAADSAEVLKKWSLIKKNKEARKHLLDGIPKSMPATLIAQRYSSRAASVGFDWTEVGGLLDKVDEERRELSEAIENNDRDNMEEELGDLLFVVINLGRKLGIDSEGALKRCCAKFKARFDTMEELDPTCTDGQKSLDELEELWQRAKAVVKEKR